MCCSVTWHRELDPLILWGWREGRRSPAETQRDEGMVADLPPTLQPRQVSQSCSPGICPCNAGTSGEPHASHSLGSGCQAGMHSHTLTLTHFCHLQGHRAAELLPRNVQNASELPKDLILRVPFTIRVSLSVSLPFSLHIPVPPCFHALGAPCALALYGPGSVTRSLCPGRAQTLPQEKTLPHSLGFWLRFACRSQEQERKTRSVSPRGFLSHLDPSPALSRALPLSQQQGLHRHHPRAERCQPCAWGHVVP